MQVKTKWIQLNLSDGTQMSVFVAKSGNQGHFPGILILQEAFGVNEHIQSVAVRFAEQGYTAAAPELFHRTAPGFKGDYTNFEKVMPHVQALTLEGLKTDILAVYSHLSSDPETNAEKIACIGFCMGGRASYIASSTVPIQAAISFYGGGIAPDLLDLAPQLNSPLLFFWGGLDQHIPPTQHRAVADALTAEKKEFVNVEFSNANHGFFCDARASYHKPSAEQAWALSLAFLKTHLQR